MPLEVTPQDRSPKAADQAAERRLRRLLDLVRGRRRPLVQLQHNPDPDAIASGFALRHLLRRFFKTEIVIAFTGTVGRAENRAMVRYLNIRIHPAFRVRYAQHDCVLVVDTQPGTGTCRLPEGLVPDVVMDHHPGRGRLEGVGLAVVEPGYGATSTILGELFLANGIPLPRRVATALAYGIQTDTQDLARAASPADERVFTALHAAADKRLLGRIQRARVPAEYFQALERGLRRACVHDTAVSTHLGTVEHPDLVAEVADLLFRLEGMTWAFVTGAHARVLYASVRGSGGEGGDAGEVARTVAGPKGTGGGHETFAAAQVPIPAGEVPAAAHEAALSRFLAAIDARSAIGRPLAPSEDATPPAAAPGAA